MDIQSWIFTLIFTGVNHQNTRKNPEGLNGYGLAEGNAFLGGRFRRQRDSDAG
jgi:hypothetical protein